MSYHHFISWSNLAIPPGSSHVTHYCVLQPLNTLKLEFILSLNGNGLRDSRLNPQGVRGDV